MTGTMEHSAADVIQGLLVGLSLVTDPEDEGSWPCYVNRLVEDPDDVVTVNDTEGRDEGRTNPDNERQERLGIQIMLRSSSQPVGYKKLREIALALDAVVNRSVSIQAVVGTATVSYIVYSVQRTSGVLSIGSESPTSRRDLFTVNALVSIRQVS